MKILKSLLSVLIVSMLNLWICIPVFAQEAPEATVTIGGGKFDDVLSESLGNIQGNVSPDIVESNPESGQGVVLLIENIISNLMPVIIAAGIAVALFGAYKMMTSDKEEAVKEGMRLVMYGVLGIIIISSAKFLANTLVDGVILDNMSTAWGLNGLTMAESLYEKIFFPFIKLAIYLSVGILFFILAARVFTFLTSSDEWVRKKAWGMIARTVIWILIILAAKQVVEAIFGAREKVINQNAEDLGDIGTGIFEVSSIPIVYQVINWVMALATLVVLVLIIFQTIQMLTKPDDPEIPKRIKKTLIYVAIWVVVIGAGYVISNVLLIN